MKRFLWFILPSMFLVAPRLASAAPVIFAAPVNAASYTLNGLPSSGVSQGGMFILFGAGLGPANLLQVSQFPLPTTAGLGGTTITVNMGGTNYPCIMLYTVASQVAAILPSCNNDAAL